MVCTSRRDKKILILIFVHTKLPRKCIEKKLELNGKEKNKQTAENAA